MNIEAVEREPQAGWKKIKPAAIKHHIGVFALWCAGHGHVRDWGPEWDWNGGVATARHQAAWFAT